MINYYIRSLAGYILATILFTPIIMLLIYILCIMPVEWLTHISLFGLVLDLFAIVFFGFNKLKN